ncbi:heparinase II/III family protein [bacterium]|nr:heparinase II/III family protein [bacterium]
MGRFSIVVACVILLIAQSVHAVDANVDRREQIIQTIVRGGGLAPGQDRKLTTAEIEFRRQMEKRKDALLANRLAIQHPAMLDSRAKEIALKNIAQADWARRMADGWKRQADELVAQPKGWVDSMIPEQTPWYSFGMTCPNCVGKKSPEGAGLRMKWDWRHPDSYTCGYCGEKFPSEKYPETQALVCPRMGQTFMFYMNDKERANPDDRSGKLAYHWVGSPMHVSFTGAIRGQKVMFMIGALDSLAYTYYLTGDPKYAELTRDILLRLAHSYRNWLYYDCRCTVADCDPLYAAWHPKELKLEWKRQLAADDFKNDTAEKAALMQEYWGCGRLYPDCDNTGVLFNVAQAYDLTLDAKDKDGNPVWSEAQKRAVERDLLLEWIFGAEYYAGGIDQAKLTNNKAPRIYHAMACVARVIGIPSMADTALRGYEAIRDQSFGYDGLSHESPSYTNQYLYQLIRIPERLYDFEWPEKFAERRKTGNLYENDSRLRLMYQSSLWELQGNATEPPLSDTHVGATLSPIVVEQGARRFPELFEGCMGTLLRGAPVSSYSLFNVDAREPARKEPLDPPEIYFPDWMTAMLRHGQGDAAATLAMSFSREGTHRQHDNLALFYADGGNTILADQGYVTDAPINRWLQSTKSHNLVIVDDSEQRFHWIWDSYSETPRNPRLEMMFTGPKVSAVEASSEVYDQCKEYRRLVAMIKGPGMRTFAVDIFRVRGGKKQAYQIVSELAASDSKNGRLEFAGVTMPEEKPLPDFGASIAREAMFGLRDERKVKSPAKPWQATWRDDSGAYRFWNLGDADFVAAYNGPGQETPAPGRRSRFLNVIREGSDLTSTFFGLHEPGGKNADWIIRKAQRLKTPKAAGPNAIALLIDTAWGQYLVLNEFANEAKIKGVSFHGKFGVWCKDAGGKEWVVACGASTCQAGKLGFSGKAPAWIDEATTNTSVKELKPSHARPADWQDAPAGWQGYVLLNDGKSDTGFPVTRTDAENIRVEKFPLPKKAGTFKLMALRVDEK